MLRDVDVLLDASCFMKGFDAEDVEVFVAAIVAVVLCELCW